MTPTNPPQNSDHFALDETLGAMERLGRPEGYRAGYADGVLGKTPALFSTRPHAQTSYARGRKAGASARERGAHGYGAEVSS